ncbi:MAG: DUF4426 domain-containing protein [Pseudomonadota bacterium]|nr:DUF4426 domain-containing protein [Pseudomonadota bacterium]
MIRQRCLQGILATMLGLVSLSTLAGSKDFGDKQVLYSVFPSTFLSPEVAKANNLQRSGGIGVVSISIMEETGENTMQPLSGQVEGQVSNDIQQIRQLGFRRVTEGEAVYFIAQYQYSSGKMMTFNITARPTGADKELALRFSHTLFND